MIVILLSLMVVNVSSTMDNPYTSVQICERTIFFYRSEKFWSEDNNSGGSLFASICMRLLCVKHAFISSIIVVFAV